VDVIARIRAIGDHNAHLDESPTEAWVVRDAVRVVEGVFRGSAAVAGGLVTRAELRSARYRALFRDIYVPAGRAPDLVMWSRAASLLLPRGVGALAGYSAAELLGASCAPKGVPAEMVLTARGGIKPRPGLVVHHGALPAADVCLAGDCRVTTPLRTAWDLARRLELVEAVVAVDALARRGGFAPSALLAARATRPRAPGCRRLDEIVSLADPRAESPMESRLRMLLIRFGLPRPVLQHEVFDRYGFVVARLDLAYPEVKLAIEYDGVDPHRGRRVLDNRRDMAVAELGWETMRFGHEDIWTEPRATAARVHRMLDVRRTLFGIR